MAIRNGTREASSSGDVEPMVGVKRLIRKAHGMVGAMGKVHIDIHLVEPDQVAWHLRISDGQLTTYAVIGLEPGLRDLEWALIQHRARKIELAGKN